MNRSEQEWNDMELDRAVADNSHEVARHEPLTAEERAFYATLPAHLGKVRMARLVALVDALSEQVLELTDIERAMRESNASLRDRVSGAIDAITSARLVAGSADAAWSKQALEALRGR